MSRVDEGAISLYYGYQLKSKTGKIKRQATRRGHSFTTNFLKLLYAKMGLRGVQYTNTSGATISEISAPTSIYFPFGSSNSAQSEEGLCVGTGTNAAAVTDYNLQTKILHGTSAGRLQYSGGTGSSPTTDATSTSFTLTRVFSNASGGTIVVAEIGLLYYSSGYILWARDLLSPSVSVLNGEQLTVNYIIKVTV